MNKSATVLLPDSYKDRIDEAELRLRDMALGYAVKVMVAQIEAGKEPLSQTIAEAMLKFLRSGSFTPAED